MVENTEESKKAQPEAPESEIEPVDKIDKANLAAERMESANRERARLLKIEEKMLIERKLSGSTEAGQAPAKPAEETAKEYADRVLSGKIK